MLYTLKKIPVLKKELVRVKGLEPPRPAPPEPKSGVSTNSTTPAVAHFNLFAYYIK